MFGKSLSKNRFAFGKNWNEFLNVLNEPRIQEAEKSLLSMLDMPSLSGLRFLDIGSGSGLFSLAARRLGADVTSFDFDPDSVACTKSLREKYFSNDKKWSVQQGSVLDKPYLESLGQFDIVYSWGVLHHTGNMRQALGNAGERVKQNGLLFIALYNDQGWSSRFWWWIKKGYNSSIPGRFLVCAFFIPLFALKELLKSIVLLKNTFRAYKSYRGMSVFYDWIDWLGGFPFEVASPSFVNEFFEAKGFSRVRVQTTKSWGNNQFIYLKMSDSKKI